LLVFEMVSIYAARAAPIPPSDATNAINANDFNNVRPHAAILSQIVRLPDVCMVRVLLEMCFRNPDEPAFLKQ
jgi:hypothetical protein